MLLFCSIVLWGAARVWDQFGGDNKSIALLPDTKKRPTFFADTMSSFKQLMCMLNSVLIFLKAIIINLGHFQVIHGILSKE